MRGVCLQEVFISGGSTVCIFYKFAYTLLVAISILGHSVIKVGLESPLCICPYSAILNISLTVDPLLLVHHSPVYSSGLPRHSGTCRKWTPPGQEKLAA